MRTYPPPAHNVDVADIITVSLLFAGLASLLAWAAIGAAAITRKVLHG
jgi:hypothetical protein